MSYEDENEKHKGALRMVQLSYTTLERAREWLKAAAGSKRGAICPCCDRHDKVYKRSVNAEAVRDLISLWRLSRREGRIFYHYTQFMRRIAHGDFAKFKKLGLIERAPKDDKKDTKTSGMYRITASGVDFVEGRKPIQEYMFIYHDKLMDTDGRWKFITQGWKKFSYSELMGN